MKYAAAELNLDALMTIRTLADKTEYSEATIRRCITAAIPPKGMPPLAAKRVGREYRITGADAAEWINQMADA